MPSRIDTLVQLVEGHTNALNNQYNNTRIELTSQDMANDGKAIPENASWAAQEINSVVVTISSIAGSMVSEAKTREDSWQGPAADAFFSIHKTFLDHVHRFHAALYPTENRGWAYALNQISEAHQSAINKNVTLYNHAAEVHNETVANIENKTIYEYHNMNLYDIARRLDGISPKSSNWKEFNDKYMYFFDMYQDSFTTNFDDFKTKQETSTNGATQLFLAVGNEFQAPSKAMPFESADPYNPSGDAKLSDRDKDGTPDYLDGYPDDPTRADKDPPELELADRDGDSTPDFQDDYPDDPTRQKKEDEGLPDRDGDGTPDAADFFPDDPDRAGPQPQDPPEFDEPETPESAVPEPQDGSTLPPELAPAGLADSGDGPAPAPGGALGLDGDGATDVAAPGGVPLPGIGPGGALSGAPGPSPSPGNRLASGRNGEPGFDLTGDGVADVGLGGDVLPGGGLPPGSQVVTGPDGVRGVDLTGDGVPDVDFDGRALPGGSAPPGSRLVTGRDGTPGFDLTGDGRPDVDLSGDPLPVEQPAPARPGAGGSGSVPDPGGQVVRPPAGADFPGQTPGRGALGEGALTPATASGLAGAPGYPPMMPPMMPPMTGGQNEKNERETWLQEDDEVWRGDDRLLPVLALGRDIEDDEPEDVPDSVWEEPPVTVPAGNAGGRAQRQPTGGPQYGTGR